MTDIDAVRAAIFAGRNTSREMVRRWVASEGYKSLTRRFADCPADDPEPAAKCAEKLFAGSGWAEALLDPLVEALGEHPLFEPAFKSSRDRLRTGMVLFDCPAASIVASVTDSAALLAAGPPGQVVFSGRLSVMQMVRSGGAMLRRWRLTADKSRCASRPPVQLEDGMVLRCDGQHEAHLLEGARRDIVTIVATIRAGAAPFLRAHDAVTLEPVRLAYADDRPSRTEMLLALLRAAGRADAGDRFEAVTRDADHHLRWAAMRQWLALDARAAHPRLVQMAERDPSDAVRTAAVRTLAHVTTRLITACLA